MDAKSTKPHSAQKTSVWDATAKMPKCRPLDQDMQTDVCVVGAGISGLTTAYLLGKSGKSVVLIDDGELASGQTMVTSAHLSNVLDDRFVQIERWHGEDGSRLAAESHAAAIDRIETTANELDIDCDFARIDGYLFLAPGDKPQTIDDEYEAARRAGMSVDKLAKAPLNKFESGPCLRFPDQARFHPLKYLAGVADAVKQQGGKIFTKTHADGIEGGPTAKVKVGSHSISASAVVVATNAPINDMFAIHTKQAPYMTYVIGAKVPRGSVTDALYWDTEEFYHYIRLQHVSPDAHVNGEGGFDLLIVGGEDHKSGQADDTEQRHGRLEAWARSRFPIEEVVFTWGGQYMEPIDGLAFIGRNPLDKDNIYVVTGDSGMGLTHGTIAGMLLTDLINGRENRWEKLYEPSRKPVKAAGRFVKEQANVAKQYTKWLTPGQVSSTSEIQPGSGAVMRRGMSKVAVYRDPRGKPHEMSAVCPHLGCIVRWNNAETTWDCPCHGSRFDPHGKVLNGPSNVDLPPAEG